MGRLIDTTLFELVHDFIKVHLPNEKKRSPHTIRSYQKSLELLFDFVKAQNRIKLREVTFEMIDRRMLASFLDYLENERNCSIATRNQRLQCIRAFYGYAAKVNSAAVIHWIEIKKVDTAAVPETLVEHMSEAAIEALLSQPDTRTKKGLRDMFLMLLLYHTGARVQELLDIRLRDIHQGKSPTITLHGKGSKVRSVPLRDTTALHLKEYLKLFHPDESMISKQYLFFTKRDGAKKRMTEDNVRRLVRKYGAQAQLACLEIPDNVHPHLFRHSRAMHLYQNGVDLTLVSQWLGHKNLETTLIYAHADTELKRKAIERAIPEESSLKEHLRPGRYKIDDDDTLKRLYGLK
jgi:site-specific recombinase XerD